MIDKKTKNFDMYNRLYQIHVTTTSFAKQVPKQTGSVLVTAKAIMEWSKQRGKISCAYVELEACAYTILETHGLLCCRPTYLKQSWDHRNHATIKPFSEVLI